MSRIQDILTKAEREGRVRPAAPEPLPAGRHEGASPLPQRPAAPPAPPSGSSSPAVRALDREPLPAADPVRQAGGHAFSPLLVAALAPHAVAAEQYRTLRTRIMLAENGHARRVILVTSPASGDGKSVTAANLALTMAQEFSRRVVLVDADLRRPGAHALLGVPGEPGLSDVLAGMVPLDQALVEVPDVHLTVLPSGLPPGHPAELLGSTTMRRTLDALRSRFDRVVIDMPPAVPLADVGVVAPLVDGVLLVVRAGVTPKPLIERALAGFDGDRLLGLVLNASGGEDAAYGYESAAMPPAR